MIIDPEAIESARARATAAAIHTVEVAAPDTQGGGGATVVELKE